MSDRSEPLVNHSNQGAEAGLAPDQPVASAEFDYLGRGEFASRLVVSQLWNRKGKGGEVWIGRPGF